MSRQTNTDLKSEIKFSSALTLVLSIVFWIMQAALGLGTPYWVCLLVAAMISFLGVFIWVSVPNRGGRDGDDWLG